MSYSLRGADLGPGLGDELLTRLRTETADQHSALEAELNLLRADFTLSEYKQLLERFYGFYVPWEAKAFSVLEGHALALTEGRRKTPRLMEDLRFFGIRAEMLALNGSLPPLNSYSQVIGSMYVMEGSTLGGQLLARHFSKALDFRAEGLSFFRCYGERTGAMWKSFRQALDEEENDAEVAVISARHTFEALGRWLLSRDGSTDD